ncbi:MAG: hypothetical protein MRZ79_12785 [Bacteroidia bacterium]|nr:hypothetical protein [Bacteroidia bacterium]
MSTLEKLNEIRDKIDVNDLEGGIKDFLSLFIFDRGSEYGKLASAISRRFHQLKSEEVRHIISKSEANLGYNQLTDDLLNLLNQLQDDKGFKVDSLILEENFSQIIDKTEEVTGKGFISWEKVRVGLDSRSNRWVGGKWLESKKIELVQSVIEDVKVSFPLYFEQVEKDPREYFLCILDHILDCMQNPSVNLNSESIEKYIEERNIIYRQEYVHVYRELFKGLALKIINLQVIDKSELTQPAEQELINYLKAFEKDPF